jgi:putative transposase
MSTYTQIIYQIVFGTKNRERTLTKEKREELYKYISGVILNKKCHLYRINGVEDHIHILTHLHPGVALADLVKDIKLSSSDYIKRTNLFTNFRGWSEGYGAFTYSIRQKDILIEYIKNQEEHHKTKNYREEYIEMLTENGVKYNEIYVL